MRVNALLPLRSLLATLWKRASRARCSSSLKPGARQGKGPFHGSKSSGQRVAGTTWSPAHVGLGSTPDLH